MKNIYVILLMGSVLLFTACDMLDIKPTGKVIPTTLAEYRALMATAYQTVPDARGLAGFRSDEMYVKNDSWELDRYAKIERWDDYSALGQTTTFEWKNFYTALFLANYTIEQQGAITEGSEEDIHQLIGECYLMRAYMHFLLVNLYGQPYSRSGALDTKAIPLKLDSDINGIQKRNTVAQVYESVLSDIAEAERLINKESWENKFSYRFTVLSVRALRSRAYLYMGNWEGAYLAAESVLAEKSTLEDFNAETYALPNHYQSVEAITALERIMSSNYNQAGAVSSALLSMYGEGDLRPDAYFKVADKNGDRFSQKGGKDDFRCSFRVGEMYLNAAEAAAQSGKLVQARTRLLELMQKRYTPEAYTAKTTRVNAMDKEALIQEIGNERARELAFEGHRWFDLRRTTRPRIEKVLGDVTYVLEQDDPRYTIQIPREAIAANPELAN
ncbi:RagB/SusD family nutrient uptake outer membrane protein [Bacteroides sp.]